MECVNHLPNHKAPGPDNLTLETLKYCCIEK